MLHLMKKFCLIFLVFTALSIGIMFPLFNHDRLTGPNPLDLSFVFYLTPYLFWVAIGSIWGHEQMEAKTNSNDFLRLLPIKESEIVAAKFTLVFLSVAIFTAFHLVAFALISTNPDYFNPSLSYLVINADICLLFAALLYLGIFKFGFSKFGKIVVLSWFLAVISPIPLNLFLLPKLAITKYQIIEWVINFNWIVLTIISLAVYLGLMQVAIKLSEAERAGKNDR